ncbi:HAD family hydrolase [Paenibacillus sp. GYB004]|uniref:HAD family hydrolase n=1 Tax=Paenibacillus sp. GYB004 TaxID=2994393 RepID=UPI002F961F10
MTYKLIALDLDGTLLNKNKSISAENVKWIRAAGRAGMKITLATGRPISDVTSIVEQLEIDCPLVINNGSEVWHAPGDLHSRRELSPHSVAKLFELLESNREELDFWAHTVGGRINRSNVPADVTTAQWLQFAIRSSDPEQLRTVRERIVSWKMFEISNSHVTNMECNAPGVTKASGLLEVCSIIGIEMSQVIAIGDSLNDIPMIRAAGLGVAMGNAQEPVKQAADRIAPTNLEDGVAKVIEQVLLS